MDRAAMKKRAGYALGVMAFLAIGACQVYTQFISPPTCNDSGDQFVCVERDGDEQLEKLEARNFCLDDPDDYEWKSRDAYLKARDWCDGHGYQLAELDGK